MKKGAVRNLLDSMEVIVSLSAMVMLIVIVSIQVFCRYVLQNSLDWTEEMARYLVIWSVLFGCSYAMRSGSHLELSLLKSIVGKEFSRYVECFACLVCCVFSGIMIYAGTESVVNIHWSEQLTPAMQLPAWIIWMAMPVGFAFMGIQAFLRCWDILSRTPSED